MLNTSPQGKRPKSLGSTNGRSDAGTSKGKSKPSGRKEGNDDITSKAIQLELNLAWTPESTSSTPESVLALKNPTLTAKLNICKPDIQTEKSSQKLEGDLTSNARKCLPYWDESCQEISSALWSLTKTDWQGSDLTCFDGCANKTGANSWFSTNQVSLLTKKWLRTSSPSFTVSAQGFTDSASTRLRCRKIRIYPSVELNKVWRKWLGACRYCFNQAIAYQRQNKPVGKLKLRNIIMQSDLPEWVKQTPCHIRQNAIFDAHRAYSASREAKFRSCRDAQQTIKFNDCNFSSGCWYPKLTKRLSFISSEPLPQTCPSATQLTFYRGRWFAIMPEEMPVKRKDSYGVIALDPGVRTFLTGFDGSRFIEFGSGDIGRITRVCQHLDNLISRMSKVCRKQRRRMRQAAHRMRSKIKNLIDEAHKQIVCYLTDNYRIIFLPTFETSQMVAKARRKIRAKTVRSMLTWAHYRFELFLAQKAEMTNTIVITGSEAYTSKTCTKCGHVHQCLGGSKVFKCPSCGHVLPRDMNGALGFMLRALRDTAFTVNSDGVAIAALSGNFPYCVA